MTGREQGVSRAREKCLQQRHPINDIQEVISEVPWSSKGWETAEVHLVCWTSHCLGTSTWTRPAGQEAACHEEEWRLHRSRRHVSCVVVFFPPVSNWVVAQRSRYNGNIRFLVTCHHFLMQDTDRLVQGHSVPGLNSFLLLCGCSSFCNF